MTTFFANKANRQWMRRVSSDPAGVAKIDTDKDGQLIADNVLYVDWVGPLTFLLDYIAKEGPYDGVLGFSQGANVAVLLAALMETGALPNIKFDFVISICGSAFGWERQWQTASDVLSHLKPLPLFKSPLKTKSMHFIGTADPFRAASEKLVHLFQSQEEPDGVASEIKYPIVNRFTSGHKPPTQKVAAAALADFLKLQF